MDDQNFQLHAENHFDPRSRMQSPFLSLTDDKSRAVHLCHRYVTERRSRIKLLEINAQDLVNEKDQYFWRAQDIVTAFRLKDESHYYSEYLIKWQIPEHYVRAVEWQ